MAVMLKAGKPKSAVVPDGVYRAVLTSVKQFQNSFGERIGFEFTLKSGPGAGQSVMRSTSPVMSPTGKLADVLRGLLGRELTQGELSGGFDAEELVGTEVQVLVRQASGKSGVTYSNVEAILPAA